MSDESLPAIERPEERLEFETLISDTSALLIASPPEVLDSAVQDSLERARRFLQVDRCGILSVSADGRFARVRVASYSKGVSRTDVDLSLGQMFPWSWRLLQFERAPVRVSRLADLPPEADTDRKSLAAMATRSALVVPIETGGAIENLIILHAVHAERSWPDALAQRLRVFGEILVGALQRHEMFAALRETEERLSLAADSAGAGLWDLDLATQVFWATPRAKAIFGFAADEVVTMDRFEARIHPDDRRLVDEATQRAFGTGDPIRVEFRITRPGEDGARWVSTLGRSHVAPDGRPVRLAGATLDVSERRRADEALHTSEARLAAGAELAGLAFYEVDWQAGGIRYADDRTRDLLGLPLEGELGLEATEFWLSHVHPDDRPRLTENRSRLLSGDADRFSVEYRYMHPRRGELWIHQVAAVIVRDADGRALRSYGVYRDVTARKRTEEELRDLSRRLIGAHEEERALLARELHDDVSQRLAVLAIEAGRAELGVREGPQAEAMRTIREGLVRVSEDVHSLAYQLHPSVLEELGLAEALRAECEHRRPQYEFALTVNVDPLLPVVDRDAALCLFRVAQEALRNAARHARASAVTVTLRSEDGGLLLTVVDDGVGFDPGTRVAGRHLGLASMHERTRLVHGTLDVDSAPGGGTTIVAWVPAEGGDG